MENYLISEAIGDIAGSAYEGHAHRIKDYKKVKRQEIFRNVFRYSFDYIFCQKVYCCLFVLSSSIIFAARAETPALPTAAISAS